MLRSIERSKNLAWIFWVACWCWVGPLWVQADPAKWEKEIQAFEKEDQSAFPPENAVVFVGSSSIRLWTNLSSAFPNIKAIRRGFGGSHIEDAIYYADRIVVRYRPVKVVLYAGDNDIASGKTPHQVLGDFKEFASSIHRALPNTEIIFISIKPSPARWHLAEASREANRLVREWANQAKKIRFVDIWKPMLNPKGEPDPELFVADKLHLNEKGYELWRRELVPFLMSTFPGEQ